MNYYKDWGSNPGLTTNFVFNPRTQIKLSPGPKRDGIVQSSGSTKSDDWGGIHRQTGGIVTLGDHTDILNGTPIEYEFPPGSGFFSKCPPPNPTPVLIGVLDPSVAGEFIRPGMTLPLTLSNNMAEQVGTDRALIDQARTGDEVALRALIERYEPQVAATVVGMLGPGDEADDVGQETFVRFYQSLDKFRGDAALGTYLTRIAINLSLNALERRKRQRWRFWSRDDEQAPPEPSVDGRDEQTASERAQAVHAALDQLKPAFRAVVVLRMIEGYSTKETAALLEIAEGTVLSRLSRGMKQLETILKDEDLYD